MVLLRAQEVAKSYGARAVLGSVSLAVGEHDRIGLVGANGAGKSTLLRILAGEIPDEGEVTRASGVRVGLLEQELSDLEGTAWDTAIGGAAEILMWRQEWTHLAEEIAGAPMRDDLVQGLGEVQSRLEAVGGFALEAQLRRVLHGVGFPEVLWAQPVGQLSGGERTRLNLARTLLGSPDILLLDEPTNHLDVPAIEWLEKFLAGFRGAVVIVSHDRRLLDRTVRRVVELEGGLVRSFAGNYSAYRAALEQEMAAREAAYAQHKQEVARLQEFVRRQLERAARIQGGPKRGRDYYGRIAKKIGKQAQVARHRLERLEAAAPENPQTPDRLHLTVETGEGVGPALAHLRKVTLDFGSRPVLSNVTLTLGRGDRIGLVGANGSGKTTLLRLLAGQRAAASGEVWVGPGVRAGYLAQIPFHREPARRVIDVALDAGLDPTEARAVLGALLFRGDRVFQAIGDLSGGERTRLALLEFAATRCNLLLLDEPSNHLDLSSRERLEDVLEAYPGTIVVASHDRFLLDRLCTRVWAIAGGTVIVFEGNYTDYLSGSGGATCQ